MLNKKIKDNPKESYKFDLLKKLFQWNLTLMGGILVTYF